MGQLSVTGIPPATVPEQSDPVVPQQRSEKRELASALRAINESGVLPADREVTFSTDTTTRKLVVQVVDKQSRSVVVQWPSAYALQMAKDYRSAQARNETAKR